MLKLVVIVSELMLYIGYRLFELILSSTSPQGNDS